MAAAPKIPVKDMQKALNEPSIPQSVTETQPSHAPLVFYGSGSGFTSGSLLLSSGAPINMVLPTVMLGSTVSIEDDFHGWLLDQASMLRNQRYFSLDLNNLSEELEAMARGDRTEVISHLRNLLANFLKLAFSAKRRSERSWKGSIVRARLDLSLMVDDSATLRNELPAFLTVAYRQARTLAASEMRLEKHQAQELFPDECPWSPEQLRDEDFLPAIDPNANGR
jgi:Domain of unknown function DUF29